MAGLAGARESRWRFSWLIPLLLSSWCLISAGTAQATALPSTITENTTLTAAGNPYTGSPTVEAGVTLKAEPGVKFNIGKLIVKGTLVAEGTAESPVVFPGYLLPDDGCEEPAHAGS